METEPQLIGSSVRVDEAVPSTWKLLEHPRFGRIGTCETALLASGAHWYSLSYWCGETGISRPRSSLSPEGRSPDVSTQPPQRGVGCLPWEHLCINADHPDNIVFYRSYSHLFIFRIMNKYIWNYNVGILKHRHTYSILILHMLLSHSLIFAVYSKMLITLSKEVTNPPPIFSALKRNPIKRYWASALSTVRPGEVNRLNLMCFLQLGDLHIQKHTHTHTANVSSRE